MTLFRELERHHALHVPSRSPRFAAVRAGLRSGRLARVLPGVFCLAGRESLPHVRAAAVCALDSTAVLVGRAALAVTLEPDAWPAAITFTTRRRWRNPPPWAQPRRGCPAEHLVGRFPLPHVAAGVALLQVASVDGAGVLDDALRQGLVTPDQLREAGAALAHTPGGRRRRALVRGSLRRPWSGAERELHAVLVAAGVTGWRGNVRVRAGGRPYVLDLAFADRGVAVEVDGWTHHGSREAFEADRRRDNDLVAAGWLVLHVTPTMIAEEPARVVAWIRAALALRTQ